MAADSVLTLECSLILLTNTDTHPITQSLTHLPTHSAIGANQSPTSPEALRGDPARETLVRRVPSAATLEVAEVMGLLPQLWESNVVWQGITRAAHPGNPPAATKAGGSCVTSGVD